jgi:hypothetical protein
VADDPHERIPDACSLVDADALDDPADGAFDLGWDRGGSRESQDEVEGITEALPSALENPAQQANLLCHQLPHVVERPLHPKGWRAGGEQQSSPAAPGIYGVVIPFRFCTGGRRCAPSLRRRCLHRCQEFLAAEPPDDLGHWAVFRLACAPSPLQSASLVVRMGVEHYENVGGDPGPVRSFDESGAFG